MSLHPFEYNTRQDAIEGAAMNLRLPGSPKTIDRETLSQQREAVRRALDGEVETETVETTAAVRVMAEEVGLREDHPARSLPVHEQDVTYVTLGNGRPYGIGVRQEGRHWIATLINPETGLGQVHGF